VKQQQMVRATLVANHCLLFFPKTNSASEHFDFLSDIVKEMHQNC